MIWRSIIFIFLTSFFLSTTQSEEANSNKRPDPEETKRVKLLKLINEEIKTITTARNLGPRLKNRLLELYTEKLAIIKERENIAFLNANPNERTRLGKAHYFQESTKLFQQTFDYGKNIIRDFPTYVDIGEVYYTMALNSRDYGDGKFTEYFLNKTLEASKKRPDLLHDAKVSLAEYYYNGKEYKEAIRYYNDVIKNLEDDWYSRHLYNMAWCYLKTSDLEKAISNVVLAYDASKNKKYLSIEDQILENAGTFYIYGSKVAEGVTFYIQRVKDPIQFLLKMAQSTTAKGRFDDSHFIIQKATAVAIAQKNKIAEAAIYLDALDIYRQFDKEDLYFKAAADIFKVNSLAPILEEQRARAVETIKSMAGIKQVKLAKDSKLHNADYKESDLKRVMDYFRILSGLDSSNKDEYQFYQAESLFSVAQYAEAIKYYISGLNFSKKVAPKDRLPLKQKILDSMLGTIEYANLPKAQTDQYLLYAYGNYVTLWPRHEQSRKIYPKLFNLNIEIKDLTEAVSVLQKYNANYPEDIATHKAMLAQVIDIYISKKDVERLTFWIKKLKSGYLSFDKKYIDKATLILGDILFASYQAMDTAGNKTGAIAGYMALFKNEEYPTEIKAKTSWNISVLYLEQLNVEESYKWLLIALAKNPPQEIEKLYDKMDAMADQYYLLQNFEKYLKIAKILYPRVCNTTLPMKTKLFKNIVQFNLLEKNPTQAISEYKDANRCRINKEVIDEMGNLIITMLYKHNDYKNFFNFYETFQDRNEFADTFALTILEIYWEAVAREDQAIGQRALAIISKNKSSGNNEKLKISSGPIFDNEEYKKELAEVKQIVLRGHRPFVEETFNSELENLLTKLKAITDRGMKIVAKKQPESTMITYLGLSNLYKHIGQMLLNLTPEGEDLPEEFIQGFKDQMSGMAKEIMANGQQYEKNIKSGMSKSDILTIYNEEILGNPTLFEIVKIKYKAKKLAITADSARGIQ